MADKSQIDTARDSLGAEFLKGSGFENEQPDSEFLDDDGEEVGEEAR